MIAGERDGWDYVWPRDAAAGAIALEAAGLRPEARRVAAFLAGLDLDRPRASTPTGSPVPGRPAAGDGEGWIAAGLSRTVCCLPGHQELRTVRRMAGSPGLRRERHRRPARQRDRRGRPGRRDPAAASRPRVAWSREEGTSWTPSAAWAATVFPSRGLRGAVRETLLAAHPRVDPLRHPADRGLDAGRGLDRADRLVGLGAHRAGRDPSGGSAARPSCIARRRRTERSPSEWMRRRAPRPRPRRSPGRTPSRSWRSELATAEPGRAGEGGA